MANELELDFDINNLDIDIDLGSKKENRKFKTPDSIVHYPTHLSAAEHFPPGSAWVQPPDVWLLQSQQ